RRGHAGELAEQGSDGGALGTGDHDLGHGNSNGVTGWRDYRPNGPRRGADKGSGSLSSKSEPDPLFPFEQLAADQHPADLVGAGADGVELGVAQDPPGRVFVDVAVAAQGLDGLQG